MFPLRGFHLSNWLAFGLTQHSQGNTVGCCCMHALASVHVGHVRARDPKCHAVQTASLSLKHGRTRHWKVSRESRQRSLTWSQPPAQHVNACRVLREPAGTRGMRPESTRSHLATYDTATCPERACRFATKNLHVGRTCRGILRKAQQMCTIQRFPRRLL